MFEQKVCLDQVVLTFSGQGLQDAAAGCGQVGDGLPLLLSGVGRFGQN